MAGITDIDTEELAGVGVSNQAWVLDTEAHRGTCRRYCDVAGDVTILENVLVDTIAAHVGFHHAGHWVQERYLPDLVFSSCSKECHVRKSEWNLAAGKNRRGTVGGGQGWLLLEAVFA